MPPTLPRRSLFGFNFVDTDGFDVLVDALLDRTGADPTIADPLPIVVTPNVDLLVHLDRRDSPRAAALVDRAAYVLADGQPIVWASRLLRSPLQQRLAGSTLTALLWPRLVKERRSVLVIAASATLAEQVRADYPKARVVVPPVFAADDQRAIEAIAAECVEVCAGEPPEFVFVGLSYPKQYVVLDELLTTWPGEQTPGLFLAVGASLEMYYGLRPRAPEWVQRIGLEWFHRFLLEPRRLFRRYFIDDVAFVRIVWREHRTRCRRLAGELPVHKPAPGTGAGDSKAA